MSNKKYTRYSKMNREESTHVNDAKTEPSPEAKSDLIVDDILDVVECVGPIEVIEKPAETVEPDIRKFGRVNGCKKLNIRKLPSKDATIITELVEDAEVIIDESASTALFYKVYTECGIEGYCMKQYIKVQI